MRHCKRLSLVALVICVPFLTVAGFAQNSDKPNDHSADAQKVAAGQEAQQEESKYTKDYLKKLSSTELASLFKQCADGLLSNTECTSIREENSRREREKDRPVDMETIYPTKPFGGVYQLEEHSVSPPSSHSVASESETIIPADPRDNRDRNRDTPPSIIPTYDDGPGQRNNDRKESKSESD
ncbi:MAG: hypothetical protein OXG24_00815 [Gammaproteobacteria bacterium]|nr:hypothetical protein [Gammaproteobacteria bacterium]